MEPTTRVCSCVKETQMSLGHSQPTAKATTYNFQISRRSRIAEILKKSRTNSNNRPRLMQPTKITQDSGMRTILTIYLRSMNQLRVTLYLYSLKKNWLNSAKSWKDHCTLNCKRSVNLVRDLSARKSSLVSSLRISQSTPLIALTASSNLCPNSSFNLSIRQPMSMAVKVSRCSFCLHTCSIRSL